MRSSVRTREGNSPDEARGSRRRNNATRESNTATFFAVSHAHVPSIAMYLSRPK